MHAPNGRINKVTLMNQMEIYRKFFEHQKRIEQVKSESRYSPSLKKSISYDRQKNNLFNDFKLRKKQHADHLRRENSKNYQHHNMKILSNILDQDRRPLTFSLNHKQQSDQFLHHNSMVYNSKQSNKVDQQNTKIHFRLTNAKSLYSQKILMKSSHSRMLLSASRDLKQQNKIVNPQSIRKNNTQMYDKSLSLIKNRHNSTQRQKLKIFNTKQKQMIDFSYLKARLGLANNQQIEQYASKSMAPFWQTKIIKPCQRIRKQKLAESLFTKKLKIQNSIMSKLRMKQ